jgi:hypothetical protein
MLARPQLRRAFTFDAWDLFLPGFKHLGARIKHLLDLKHVAEPRDLDARANSLSQSSCCGEEPHFSKKTCVYRSVSAARISVRLVSSAGERGSFHEHQLRRDLFPRPGGDQDSRPSASFLIGRQSRSVILRVSPVVPSYTAV